MRDLLGREIVDNTGRGIVLLGKRKNGSNTCTPTSQKNARSALQSQNIPMPESKSGMMAASVMMTS
jgi:hypothetical protein